MAFVQHDDLILVCSVIDHVPQSEQRVAARQHGLPPGGVALVADYEAAAIVCDGFIQDRCFLGLLQTSEVILREQKYSFLLSEILMMIFGTVRTSGTEKLSAPALPDAT